MELTQSDLEELLKCNQNALKYLKTPEIGRHNEEEITQRCSEPVHHQNQFLTESRLAIACFNFGNVSPCLVGLQSGCGLPQSLQAALHGLLKSHDFVSGVNTTIQAGGCNASRAGFIGACMAAQFGLENIPESWRKKTLLIDEIMALCNKLVTIQF